MSSRWLRSSVQNVISRWLWCSACSAHQKPKACCARCTQYMREVEDDEVGEEDTNGCAKSAGKASSSFGGMKSCRRSQPLQPRQRRDSSAKKIASGITPSRHEQRVDHVDAHGPAVRPDLDGAPLLEGASTTASTTTSRAPTRKISVASNAPRSQRTSPGEDAAAPPLEDSQACSFARAKEAIRRMRPDPAWRSTGPSPCARDEAVQVRPSGSLRDQMPRCHRRMSPSLMSRSRLTRSARGEAVGGQLVAAESRRRPADVR